MRVGTPEASFRGIIDANRSAARPLARALLTAQQVTRRPGDLGRDDGHGGIEDVGTEWGLPGLRGLWELQKGSKIRRILAEV